MKRSTLLSITILCLLLVGLTACGGKERSDTAEAAQSGSEQPAVSAGDPVAGQEKFVATCSACHGTAGEGVQGLGKDMTTSEFIADKTDKELLEFIKRGRDPSDPLNTTGIAMPPKGGNPALADKNLQDIIAYIRTIHQE
jgi:disulfide bond formation protein DsbB